jgi:hypothetical protein
MTTNFSQQLRDATTCEELLSVCKAVPEANLDIYRSFEFRDALLSQKMLIDKHRDNDELIKSVGYFFHWAIPQHLADPRRFEIGRRVLATKEVADLFIDVLLPAAQSQEAIYCMARAVCRVGYAHDGAQFFGTKSAIHEITSIVRRATEPRSVQFAVTIINNLTHDDESTELRLIFSAPENVKLLFEALDNSTDPEVTAWISGALINTSLCKDQTLLESYRSPDAVRSFLRALREAATTADSIDRCVRAMTNSIIGSESARELYQTQETADVLLECFERADDSLAIESLSSFLSHIVKNTSAEVRNRYKTEHAASKILGAFKHASNDLSNYWLVNFLYVLIYNPESFGKFEQANVHFTTPEAARVLIDAVPRVQRDERHSLQLCYVIAALVCNDGPTLERFLAVPKPLNPLQLELLAVKNRAQLVEFLEAHEKQDLFEFDNDIDRHQNFLLLLDKMADVMMMDDDGSEEEKKKKEVKKQEDLIVTFVQETMDVHFSIFIVKRDALVDIMCLTLLSHARGRGTIAVLILLSTWLMLDASIADSRVDLPESHIGTYFTPAAVDVILAKFETEVDVELFFGDSDTNLLDALPRVLMSLLKSKVVSEECKDLIASQRVADALSNAMSLVINSREYSTRTRMWKNLWALFQVVTARRPEFPSMIDDHGDEKMKRMFLGEVLDTFSYEDEEEEDDEFQWEDEDD